MSFTRSTFHWQRFPSDILTWPADRDDYLCDVIFICGNPGLIEWYIPFLSGLRDLCGSDTCIHAISQLNHTSLRRTDCQPTLNMQIEHKAAFVRESILRKGYNRKLVIMGHSVGSYIAIQVWHGYPEPSQRNLTQFTQLLEATPSLGISKALLLFPTISHIAETPNGRRLRFIFTDFGTRIVCHAVDILSYLPKSITQKVVSLYTGQSKIAIETTLKLVRDSHLVRAALIMAREEMQTIAHLPRSLRKHVQNVRIYWSPPGIDGWTSETIIQEITDLCAEEGAQANWLRCSENLPHDFCVSAKHSQIMAQRCAAWLNND